MEEDIKYTIITRNYQLCIQHEWSESKTTLLLTPEANSSGRQLQADLPKEFKEEDITPMLRKLRRYRYIRFHPHIPAITFTQLQISIVLRNKEHQDDEEEEEINAAPKYRPKYWKGKWGGLEVEMVFDPHGEKIYIAILQRKEVISACAIISQASLENEEERQKEEKGTPIKEIFQFIASTSNFSVQWEQNLLILNYKLIKSVPLLNQVVLHTEKEEEEDKTPLFEKIQLFRHIFLTELLTHMIITQFGRSKKKSLQDRDGYKSWKYEDQELQQLRSWGHRFAVFRDHPIIKYKKTKTSTHYLSASSEESANDKDSENFSLDSERTKKINYQEKKSKLQTIGKKIITMSEIQNFIFMSGRDKSKINKNRYTLHQMTQETDKTEALINYIQLLFAIYEKEQLVERKGENQTRKQLKLKHFLSQIKVKRRAKTCFKEYTKESFFHKTLNKGLRILKSSSELAYLRLPFSHMFWSIKNTYHRHKRAIFENKKQQNQKRTILLYRGFQMNEDEIKDIKKKVNGYLEIQGILSTTLTRDMIGGFAGNGIMIIEVPVDNLRGTFDNGFAHISQFSEHPRQREVLINAFNVFKILSWNCSLDQDTDIVAYTVFLQYGSLKQVEEKMQKSENLLDSQYQWKEAVKIKEKMKKKLKKVKNDMTEKEYHKLVGLLPKWEQKLQRRKSDLKEWAKEEYTQAQKKLSQWQLQLFNNTKHQQQEISHLENYAQLLEKVDERKRLAVCLNRRMKQVKLQKAVQGIHWRRRQCLVLKEILQREIRFKYKNKYRESVILFSNDPNLKKLLNLYAITNMQQSDQKFYTLLFWLAQKEILTHRWGNYCTKLQNIINKYSPNITQYFTRFSVYKKILQKRKKQQQQNEISQQSSQDGEKFLHALINSSPFYSEESQKQLKEDEQERQSEKQKKIKKYKQNLKYLKLHTIGRYTNEYVKTLSKFIQYLFEEEEYQQVIKQGKQYLNILKISPQLKVIEKVLQHLCQALKKSKTRRKKELQRICFQFNTNKNLLKPVILQFIPLILKWECWKEGRQLVLKYMKKYKNVGKGIETLNGYVMLLLSGSGPSSIQSYLDQLQFYDLESLDRVYFVFVQEYTEEQNASSKGILDTRKKEFKDSQVIEYVYQVINEKQTSNLLTPWSSEKTQFIPWQHPFHPFFIHDYYCKWNIMDYLMRGQQTMIILFCRQMLNMYQHNLSEGETSKYLRYIRTISRLHLNDWHLKQLPTLLQFWFQPDLSTPTTKEELQQVILLVKDIIKNGKNSTKSNIINKVHCNRIQKPSEMQIIRSIHARHNHYVAFTSKRRRKGNQIPCLASANY